jgi:hypothetical protein
MRNEYRMVTDVHYSLKCQFVYVWQDIQQHELVEHYLDFDVITSIPIPIPSKDDRKVSHSGVFRYDSHVDGWYMRSSVSYCRYFRVTSPLQFTRRFPGFVVNCPEALTALKEASKRSPDHPISLSRSYVVNCPPQILKKLAKEVAFINNEPSTSAESADDGDMDGFINYLKQFVNNTKDDD